MKSGYMYILECADGSYYTGSTTDLKRRMMQHQNFESSNFTAKNGQLDCCISNTTISLVLHFIVKNRCKVGDVIKNQRSLKGDLANFQGYQILQSELTEVRIYAGFDKLNQQ